MKPQKQKIQQSNKGELSNKKFEEEKEEYPTTSGKKTFAQVAMIDNKENRNIDSENAGTLALILTKLDEQIAMNKVLFNRLNKLENTLKKNSARKMK